MSEKSFDALQLILPFIDFMVRYSIFGDKSKEEFKEYLSDVTIGIEPEERETIQEFLQALDQYYDAQ